MATDRTEANRAMLSQASETQDKSKEALRRIKKQAIETETLAGLTLGELQTQGKQMVFFSVEIFRYPPESERNRHYQLLPGRYQ